MHQGWGVMQQLHCTVSMCGLCTSSLPLASSPTSKLTLVAGTRQQPSSAAEQHTTMKEYSRYVIVVDNLSSNTPTKDIEYEFGYAGRIRDLARDYKARCALVEYER